MKLNLLVAVAVGFILTACDKSPDSETSPAGQKKITVALLPKSKGNAYFISCKKGADRAAKDLNVDLLFDGPTDPDPAKQNEIVENWIALGVDAIAAACENKEGISTALRKAEAKLAKDLAIGRVGIDFAGITMIEARVIASGIARVAGMDLLHQCLELNRIGSVGERVIALLIEEFLALRIHHDSGSRMSEGFGGEPPERGNNQDSAEPRADHD